MDQSEKYIEMCRKAKEIQKHWVPYQGDWYFGPGCMPGHGYWSKETDPIENEVVMIGCSTRFSFNLHPKTREPVYTKFTLSYGDWTS